MFTPDSLIAELNDASIALDKSQRRLDRMKKTPLGFLPFAKSALHDRQVDLDCMRKRVDGATQYMLNRKS